MTGEKIEVERRMIVCVRRKCRSCPVENESVPDGRPCAIAHVLETSKDELVQMPRQSGKTTMILNLAVECARAGYEVMVFCPTYEMARQFKGLVPQDLQNISFQRNGGMLQEVTGIEVMSVTSPETAGHRLRGQKGKLIFTDEVRPDIVRKIRTMMHHCRLVCGVYT